MGPNFGIAEMLDDVVGGLNHRITRILDKVNPVITVSDILILPEVILVTVTIVVVASIDQIESIIFDNR